jgi:hypothetical protein
MQQQSFSHFQLSMVRMGWLRRERMKELLFAATELFTFSAFEGVNGVVEEEEDKEGFFVAAAELSHFQPSKVQMV